MKVRLAYGRHGLDLTVPGDAAVVRASSPPPLASPYHAVLEALDRPLGGPSLAELVAPVVGDEAARAVVVFPDLTRPMPNRTVLPPVLAALERCGFDADRITLLCATGTHRAATRQEMGELVGPEILHRYRIVDHRSDGADHVDVGQVDGIPVLLNRHYVEAQIRILTGFVEPHFFAGFSGGPKGVCPGVAATATIIEAHAPKRIADPKATWSVTVGNPVHDFVRAAAALAPPSLSVDVTIDDERRLTSVSVGPLPTGHEASCAFCLKTAVQEVAGPFDVVVSTNGGYPLDRNLYQAVKGMAAAERVVRLGGRIVMAAACQDGLPDGGAFARILRQSLEPQALVQPSAPREVDRWQAQVLGRVLNRAKVSLLSEGLDDHQIRQAQLEPVHDLDGALQRAMEEAGPKVCVLPQGPLTVAALR